MTGCVSRQHELVRPFANEKRAKWGSLGTYDEAKGKPRIALQNSRSMIAAVITPTNDPFVSLDFFSERVLAAREDETHGGQISLLCRQDLENKM